MPEKNRDTLERKIFFYRVNVGQTDGGRPMPFDARPFCDHLQTLGFDDAGAYWQSGDGDFTFCLVDHNDSPQRVRLAISRRSALPHIEQGGRTTPLQLSPAEGLAEQTHLIFFPNNIVGAEFNFYGPRVSRLRGYFRTKAQHLCEDITFEQLLRGDVLAKLERMRDLQRFELGIRRGYAAAVADADQDLGSAFDAQFRVSDAERIDVILRAKPRDPRSTLAAGLWDTAKRLLRQDGFREHASTFRVRAYNPETTRREDLNLLNDQLIAHKQVVKHDPRSRAVDSASMYSAIRAAHEELHEEIAAAASLVV
jgi:hypothetical protein